MLSRSAWSMKIARTQREHSHAPPRLGGHDAANLESLGADEHLVADLEVELREQLRPDERATVAQQLVRVGDAIAERHRALQRELRLDRVQLHHLQRRGGRWAARWSRSRSPRTGR